MSSVATARVGGRAAPRPTVHPNAERRRIALVGAGVAATLAIALALRLMLLIRSSWLLEGDDSLSTLMALAVLDGDRPIMLKNQTYAAAWEPYAMAVSYALFGISRVAAKLPALLGSLSLIASAWMLARVEAGRAAAWFAAALVAVPPAYDLVLWLKPWAPYTEVILLGSVCLACAVALAKSSTAMVIAADAQFPARREACLAVGCGLSGGLALWMHPLAIWYLAAASITLLLKVRCRGVGRWLTVLASGLLGFAVGSLPIWIFNLHTDGSTVRFVLGGTQGQSADRLAVFQAWWNNDLPRGAGLWHPWGESPVWLGVALGAVIVVALVWAVFARRTLAWRPLDAVLVFLVLIPTFLVFSGFGGPALNPYGFDATGRYAPPIWGGVAVVLGAFLGCVWQYRRWLAVGLAAVPLVVNLIASLSIDPLAAFQSPYWAKLPADNAPLLKVLAAEDVQAVWLNHWAGQPLMFDARVAHQPLVAYDWYDVQAGGIDRFPEYRPIVESAPRAAFVLVTDEAEPELERDLRRLGVAFEERRAAPYVVVIPTSRAVHPSEVTGALDYRY